MATPVEQQVRVRVELDGKQLLDDYGTLIQWEEDREANQSTEGLAVRNISLHLSFWRYAELAPKSGRLPTGE